MSMPKVSSSESLRLEFHSDLPGDASIISREQVVINHGDGNWQKLEKVVEEHIGDGDVSSSTTVTHYKSSP